MNSSIVGTISMSPLILELSPFSIIYIAKHVPAEDDPDVPREYVQHRVDTRLQDTAEIQSMQRLRRASNVLHLILKFIIVAFLQLTNLLR